MKTRIIASAILLPLLLIIVLALPKIVTAVLFGVMAAIAAYELLHSTGYVKHIRFIFYAMVMAFLTSIWSFFEMSYVWALVGIMVYVTVLFAEMMASHVKIPLEKVAICLLAGLLIPYLFTSLVRIHTIEGLGRYFILIPFIMAFLSDSGAYFAGKYLGKHKLAPVISPKKTVEGVIGGVLAAVIGMLIYCFVLDLCGFTVNYWAGVLYGALGSVGAVFGDLCFSVIKRQTGIKDYGNLIPGHGGILDRFDSMMIVGPLAELLLLILPVAVK